MYPNSEITTLAERKGLLRTRIIEHRREFGAAVTDLERPIVAVERGIDAWRRISPFVKLLAIPGGLILGRMFGGRSGGSHGRRGSWFPTLISALPLVIRGARLVLNVKSASAGKTETLPR